MRKGIFPLTFPDLWLKIELYIFRAFYLHLICEVIFFSLLSYNKWRIVSSLLQHKAPWYSPILPYLSHICLLGAYFLCVGDKNGDDVVATLKEYLFSSRLHFEHAVEVQNDWFLNSSLKTVASNLWLKGPEGGARLWKVWRVESISGRGKSSHSLPLWRR